MTVFDLSKRFENDIELTGKVTGVMKMFGLDLPRLKDNAKTHRCSFKTEPGDIIFFSGPSGSGKSVLLNEMKTRIPQNERISLEKIELSDSRAVIDCIKGGYLKSLRTLSCAGLSDVFCVLKKPIHLSEGQKYRYRLAKALASGKRYIFADEFCSSLDRITAAVISCKIRKFAKQNRVTFILAAGSDHFLPDLAPDIIIKKELAGNTKVIYKKTRHQSLFK